MTSKMAQAIKTIYKDGIVREEIIDKRKVLRDQQKYLHNNILYVSTSIGMLTEVGSFICCGPYAVIIKGREAYDKFCEIKGEDTKCYKYENNMYQVFKVVFGIWKKYLDGKYHTCIEENLPRNWRNNVEELKGRDIYKIGEKAFNPKYISHATKFLKSKIHYISIGGKIDGVFFTDGDTITFVLPLRLR
jgi:hypothetical protein